jgi:hypothetical protein
MVATGSRILIKRPALLPNKEGSALVFPIYFFNGVSLQNEYVY